MTQERPAITIYDNTQTVLGMFTSRGEAIQAALSKAPVGPQKYWDNTLQKFVYGEVWWDGGKPDQYGGRTRGELLAPLFPDDALQWRLMGAPARSQARFWHRGSSEENED
jgi:hypothetical protein